MRVLIISANREEINMRAWPLGAACVATAALKAGHDVELLDLMQKTNPIGLVETTISEFHPDVIGLSIRNIDNQSMTDTQAFLEEGKELVIHLRKTSSAPLVLGGAGYSIYSKALLDYLKADMGIRGDGEAAFIALLERLALGADISKVPGLCLPNRECAPPYLPRDLDQLWLPDKRFLPDQDLADDKTFWLPLQTRRGCPLKCSYCSTPAIEGCALRKRTPELVVNWLRMCVDLGFSRYYFVDNTFNLPAKYAKQLCSGIVDAGLKLQWRCILYPLSVTDSLAAVMAEAGCKEVSVGFEAGVQSVLTDLNKRFTADQVRDVCVTLGKHAIRRMGFLLLGGPEETEETARQSLEFADSLELEAVKVSVGIRIYPDTKLAAQAVEDGVVKSEDDLLSPRFYVRPGLSETLQHMGDEWTRTRPNWMR